MRTYLLAGLRGLSESGNPAATSLVSWSNSLQALTQQQDEVDVSSSGAIESVVDRILKSAADGRVSSSKLGGVRSGLNSMLRMHEEKMARRLTDDATATTATDMLRTYADLVVSEMVPGQSAVDSISDSFSISSQVFDSSAGSSGKLSAPLSFSESLSGFDRCLCHSQRMPLKGLLVQVP